MYPDTDHLGEYYGTHFKPSMLDAIVARFVPPADMTVYADLVGKKWFGYRHLSPGQSLFLFIDRFSTEFKAAIHKNWGRIIRSDASGKINVWNRHPNYIHPHKWKEFPKGYMRAFWNAMAHADDAGIPYDFYCKAVIEVAVDAKVAAEVRVVMVATTSSKK